MRMLIHLPDADHMARKENRKDDLIRRTDTGPNYGFFISSSTVLT